MPPLASVFVATVSVAGIAAVAVSVRALLLQSTTPVEWVLFAILTIASGMLTLKMPAIDATFSVSEAFAFASVLLFGPAVGAVTLALDGIRISLRWRMSLTKTVFNFANLGLSIWAGGHVFFALSGVQPLYGGPAPPGSALAYAALMVAVYFAVNTMLTATVIALSSKRSVATVWRQHYLPLLPSYVAGAAVAMLLVLAFREVHFTAVALILPLLVICYLMFRSSFGHLEDAKKHVDALNRLLLSTVETLATAIDAKDEVTHDHVRRVQQGTLAMARALGITDARELQAIEAGALLHDTGKIAVPEHILNKPGRLTPAEFEKMKRHAPIGAEILSSIAFPYPVVPIVRHHHENWDGTGYPDGLKGEAIPLGARILSVVDCFDALTSDRPYRRRMTDSQALAIVRARRGTMYDPVVVDAFVSDYRRIMPAYDPTPHAAARAIGDARALDRATPEADAVVPADGLVADGLLAITSLSRAVSGDAGAGDVGALLWTILKQVLPCEAMAIFVSDVSTDQVVARYAAGQHAARLRTIRCATGAGVVGWVAVTLKPAVNADPVIDLGAGAGDREPAFGSCLALPIVESGVLVAVLALYRTAADAFAEDHVRLLELLAARLSGALTTAISTETALLQPAALTLVRRAHGV